jgi:pyridoxamine 5'-phosphate oxidase
VNSDPADLRRDYLLAGLTEADLAPTWVQQFQRWFAEAAAALPDPTAVVLSTASPEGVPSARTVLLKGFDSGGLVVFTNLTSRKATEAASNPHACLVVPWLALERQVVVIGQIEQVERSETEQYFSTRPRGSQISAWVSRQSTVLASRDELTARQAELERRFEGRDVPVPPFWGGLRLVPVTVEFWQGRASRLHDRLRYDLARDVVERLAP